MQRPVYEEVLFQIRLIKGSEGRLPYPIAPETDGCRNLKNFLDNISKTSYLMEGLDMVLRVFHRAFTGT